jgi:hypothetical protein
MSTSPFDQLLRKAKGEPIVPAELGLSFASAPVNPAATLGGTKGITRRIFELLAQNGRMTTRELADAVGFEKTCLIWGLMKHPKDCGRVTCEKGVWQLSETHASQVQHDINQAAQLLRKHKWTCTPPSEPNT